MNIPDLSFLYTFSIITLILNAFYYNKRINNALYLSNILSLLGYCIMMFFYPIFYYSKYNYLFHFKLFWFNIICIGYHILPVWLFTDKNNIDRSNLFTAIFDTLCLLILYYMLFQSQLHNIYPFSIPKLVILALLLLLFIYGGYYCYLWNNI